MVRRMAETQAQLRFVGWGGERDGAGRPRKRGAKLRHEARAPLATRYPAHVTLRTLPSTPNLRRNAQYAVIDRALRDALEREDFRVVHFGVQTNHIHMIVEANGGEALSRGMQGLAIRIARGVNRAAGRKGKLWADRYHARILRSPREVRLALCYVLQNTRRHAATESEIVDPEWIDPTLVGAVVRRVAQPAGVVRTARRPRADGGGADVAARTRVAQVRSHPRRRGSDGRVRLKERWSATDLNAPG